MTSHSKKRASARSLPNSESKAQTKRANDRTGELWILPELNRHIHGKRGNRGEHTTPTAELLKLADIALRKE